MLNILLESEMLDEFMPIFLGNPEILFEESQHQFFFHQDAFSLVLFFLHFFTLAKAPTRSHLATTCGLLINECWAWF